MIYYQSTTTNKM